MAIQSSLYSGTALDSRTFPSTKHIATKSHMALWRQQLSDDLWVQMNVSEYQLINNAGVLNVVLNTTLYKGLEVRVADTPDELSDSLSDIAIVVGISSEIVTVAGIEDEIVTLEGMTNVLNSLYADKATLDSIFADKTTLDSLYADKATLDSLYADKATLDSIFADKVTLDSLYADKVKLDAIYADLSNILAASGYANDAQLKAWIAEAEKMTADSYANEAEDVLVKSYTSNGDGTFTATNTTDYSSYHWSVKSAGIAIVDTPTISFATPIDENDSTVVTITNYDANVTYTFDTTVGTMSYTSGATATFNAKNITDDLDAIGVITCYGQEFNKLQSATASEPITVTYISVVADTAVTFSSTDIDTNEGFIYG